MFRGCHLKNNTKYELFLGHPFRPFVLHFVVEYKVVKLITLYLSQAK
jgi:hypothetical protein